MTHSISCHPDAISDNILSSIIISCHSSDGRYSPVYGIIFKDKLTGRWKTWVNSSVWWWGADDWATGYCECSGCGPTNDFRNEMR